jgi:hypothetical protein
VSTFKTRCLQETLRSLYGLKRAPKLWFEKLSAHLESMGLKQSSLSSCLFFSSLIEGLPPIYIGIYVDDIIYFSADDKVEREFEKRLSTIGNVDFMGQVSHFLGIEFSWKSLSDGNLSVSLTQQSFAENLNDSVLLPVFRPLYHLIIQVCPLMLFCPPRYRPLIKTNFNYSISPLWVVSIG